MAVQLDGEAVAPEGVSVARRDGKSRLWATLGEGARHLSGLASGEGDETSGMAREDLPRHARRVESAVAVRLRQEGTEVAVAGEVLGKQDEVVRLGLGARLVEAAPLRHVDLAPEDRLDARGL